MDVVPGWDKNGKQFEYDQQNITKMLQYGILFLSMQISTELGQLLAGE